MLKLDKVHYGDCRELMGSVKDESISLILTDPPYKKAYNWVWPWLAKEAERVLKPSGHLVTLVGHAQIHIAIRELSETLRYWWICGLGGNRSNKLFGINVVIKFKPALWFIKGKRIRNNEGYFPFDFIQCDALEFSRAKLRHKYAQPLGFFDNFVGTLTAEGDIVLDPFAGSGSVGIVCKQSERHFILMEDDAETCVLARRWCKAYESIDR